MLAGVGEAGRTPGARLTTSGLLDDLWSAFREIRRHPGVALVIVFTLGGAMGVNTTLFSIVNSVWFQPWRVENPERVVVVAPPVSLAEWQYWAEHSRSFAGLAVRRWAAMNHQVGPRRVFFEYVSANYFDVLGIPIARGSGFASAEDDGGVGTSAILSHETWDSWGADPRILERSFAIDETLFRVVGVIAPPFRGERLRTSLWLPLSASSRLHKIGQIGGRDDPVRAVGRLAQGVTPKQAEAELKTLSDRFRTERGLPLASLRVRHTDAFSQAPPSAQAQALLVALLLAVTFLTLLACANVANLLLARGHARRGEIAVRLSLGASRARLIRRLLLEALVLSIGAGALGVGIAGVLPDHLVASVPAMAEILLFEFRLDQSVFAWALAASVLACGVFGLVPALQCTRLSVSQVLKDAHGLAAPSLKTSLPGLQALVSVVALGVAGLVLRSGPYSFARGLARSVEGVSVVRPAFPRSYDSARLRTVGTGVLEGLQSIAGPRSVAAADTDPLSGEWGVARTLAVSPGYFEVLRIPIVAGRDFQRSDPADRVLIVNEGFARRFFPGESSLGKQVSRDMQPGVAGREVIAVVREGGTFGEPISYIPVSPEAMRVFLVRDDSQRIKSRAAGLIAALDASLQTEVLSGTAWVARAAPGSAMLARVVGEFGLLTLVLATAGLFSLSEYTVRQRTREIGILTALGARQHHVLRAIFEPALRALASGVLWGTGIAACVGFVMRRWSVPSGVDPLDTVIYAVVALILTLAGLVAAYGPARHAMRIQPSEALRYE